MEKINLKFGIALEILGILSYLGNYYDVLAGPAIVMSISLSVFLGYVAMMQTFHSGDISFSNPGLFWLTYSSINGVVLICAIYAAGIHLVGEHLSVSLIYGLSPTLVPSIGVFLGDCGRILIGKQSAI
jgi:hypothetical protein